jgi:hypothetical protein
MAEADVLRVLAAMPANARHVRLRERPVGDAFLRALAAALAGGPHFQLRHLELRLGDDVTRGAVGEFAAALRGLPALRTLRLSGTAAVDAAALTRMLELAGGNLRALTFPVNDGVTALDLRRHCPRLRRVRGHCAAGCRSLTHASLPDTLTALSSNFLWQCTALAAVDFGAGLRHIRDEVLCLTPVAAVDLAALPLLETIGNDFAKSCPGLRSVALPAGVAAIGHGFCEDCPSLAQVQLGQCKRLERVGDYFLAGSAVVRVVDMEGCGALRAVGEGFASRCEQLRDALFPPGLATVGAFLLDACPALERLRLGAGLVALGEGGLTDSGEAVAVLDLRHCTALRRVGAEFALDVGTVLWPPGFDYDPDEGVGGSDAEMDESAGM